ncbi:MAG: 4Fe-4S dicluster domain-containing protein [Candidatus Caldarchaeum sp.]
MTKALLIDIKRCIGCRSCQVACKRWYGLPGEKTSLSPSWTNPPTMTAYTWSRVRFVELDGENGDFKWRFVKEQCMHCLDPACASACFVGALHKTEEGPVDYDYTRCVGCRYCMIACPFGVPKLQWDRIRPYIQKCVMCVERIREGMKPACASACPTGAIMFGEREELLKEARKRIAQGGYVNHIYGEKEAGGTSVLYISDVPFEKLGFPKVSEQPYPKLTAASLEKIPFVVPALAAGLVALWFYSERREKIQALKEKGGGK